MKTLREAKIGDTVKVVKLHGEGPVKRRIMDRASRRALRSTSARSRPWATRWKSPSAATSCPCGRPIRK